MTDLDYQLLRAALRERCGIVLDDDKRYLMESRLTPILPRLGLATISEFAGKLRADPRGQLPEELVEALVTTESSFFRDPAAWEELRTAVLPELIRRRQSERRLTIWCGAAAAGQEPYSLAMLLRERFPELLGWQTTIVATDISRQMLARCRAGKYTQFEANRGLPAALLVKHFQQDGLDWRLNEDHRRMVDFRPMNLCGTWAALPPLDLALVRNVMIYFDVDAKKAILGKVARLLRPDGRLLLGAAETTLNLDASFQRVPGLKSGFHQLVGGAA
jgi:chemotaxis protein methyltransferase CheR